MIDFLPGLPYAMRCFDQRRMPLSLKYSIVSN
jgi:hypothetical protein